MDIKAFTTTKSHKTKEISMKTPKLYSSESAYIRILLVLQTYWNTKYKTDSASQKVALYMLLSKYPRVLQIGELGILEFCIQTFKLDTVSLRKEQLAVIIPAKVRFTF